MGGGGTGKRKLGSSTYGDSMPQKKKKTHPGGDRGEKTNPNRQGSNKKKGERKKIQGRAGPQQ